MIRLGAVGDVVRTLPAASALRVAYPGSHLAWLVEPASAALVASQPWVDEVLVFPRTTLSESLRHARLSRLATDLARFRRELRRRAFDLVIDFHAILKSGLLAAASGAPLRASYARPVGRELAWLFANARARLAPGRRSRFERNEALVHFLGVRAAPAREPLCVAPERLARIEGLLGPGPRPVAIHPGTSPTTPHKRWPAVAYGQVAQALAASAGVGCIVTAGTAREERAIAVEVVEASQGAARLAPETPTLADLAALLARSCLYVGGDTGPMHLASLVGTPVVQILGPTDPVENAPYAGTPSRTVRVPVTCSPCRRGCSAATCMRVIPPESVIAAARDLLAAEIVG